MSCGEAEGRQLFVGGYAAGIENALLHVSRGAGHRFADGDIDVVARIDHIEMKLEASC